MREINEFGYPPKFPVQSLEVKQEEKKISDPADPTNRAKKVTPLINPVIICDDLVCFQVKSKVAMKGGDVKVYQWEIMQSIGIPDEEILKYL